MWTITMVFKWSIIMLYWLHITIYSLQYVNVTLLKVWNMTTKKLDKAQLHQESVMWNNLPPRIRKSQWTLTYKNIYRANPGPKPNTVEDKSTLLVTLTGPLHPIRICLPTIFPQHTHHTRPYLSHHTEHPKPRKAPHKLPNKTEKYRNQPPNRCQQSNNRNYIKQNKATKQNTIQK